jgi:transcriptional regulator GlxA family with amidase domain
MDTQPDTTNTAFAEAVGVHFTMASRLRNGERKPGLPTVIGTVKAYKLTGDELLEWLMEIDKDRDEVGGPASGAWLRKNVFNRRPVVIPEPPAEVA